MYLQCTHASKWKFSIEFYHNNRAVLSFSHFLRPLLNYFHECLIWVLSSTPATIAWRISRELTGLSTQNAKINCAATSSHKNWNICLESYHPPCCPRNSIHIIQSLCSGSVFICGLILYICFSRSTTERQIYRCSTYIYNVNVLGNDFPPLARANNYLGSLL